MVSGLNHITGRLGLTHRSTASIFIPMNKTASSANADLDLQNLEVRVEELIRACSFLKEENKSLRLRQDHLVAERAALIEKTELARSRVEAMISRLKAMESTQ